MTERGVKNRLFPHLKVASVGAKEGGVFSEALSNRRVEKSELSEVQLLLSAVHQGMLRGLVGGLGQLQPVLIGSLLGFGLQWLLLLADYPVQLDSHVFLLDIHLGTGLGLLLSFARLGNDLSLLEFLLDNQRLLCDRRLLSEDKRLLYVPQLTAEHLFLFYLLEVSLVDQLERLLKQFLDGVILEQILGNRLYLLTH